MGFLSELRDGEGIVPKGLYSMWLPTADDPSFTRSASRAIIGELFQAAEGIESYAAAAILRQIGRVRTEAIRVTLPEETRAFPVVGPGDGRFVVSVSAEKGVRFHFSATTAPSYRDAILQGFTSYVNGLKERLTTGGYEPDPADDDTPAGWWSLCEEMAMKAETVEPIQGIGTVVME
jgi:hypothetical protein